MERDALKDQRLRDGALMSSKLQYCPPRLTRVNLLRLVPEFAAISLGRHTKDQNL